MFLLLTTQPVSGVYSCAQLMWHKIEIVLHTHKCAGGRGCWGGGGVGDHEKLSRWQSGAVGNIHLTTSQPHGLNKTKEKSCHDILASALLSESVS